VKKELNKGDVAAVIVEGIQGVGGIRISDDDFLKELSKVTKDAGTMLILDEIQSGYGRSGRFFAHQYSGIKPDMITMAKGIANGYPFAAVAIANDIKPVYGQLGTTFGGNHLGCAAALAVLDVIEDEKLIENAEKVGQYLIDNLKGLPGVKEVRGRGLMIGIEMEREAKELRRRLIFDQHIFTGAAGTNIIRLLPPLCVTKEDADRFIESFKKELKNEGYVG
ncbi:MAG: aminotransferase class III-fold pyridoxal phosphate-dependent enzyme, partial [Muribaculaceae bacterium]|nr:aminotransferase class III-fold pyridoxal phosphate-dependent enzyme [Muribaculaceae bacterium]